MNNLFFTSDLHFYHANVIKYCNRPFTSVEEMNETFIERWNSVVPPDGKVWLLGDIFFCDAKNAAEILARLNGEKHLILGNHDKLIRNNLQLQKLFFKIYPDLHQETIDGVPVIMSHYPLLTWNRAHWGSFMLHGHVHSTSPTNGIHRRYDVGVDANSYAPVSWAKIKDVLNGIEIKEPSAVRENRNR
jgi:calcineurin-like phosphoesterase family protein